MRAGCAAAAEIACSSAEPGVSSPHSNLMCARMRMQMGGWQRVLFPGFNKCSSAFCPADHGSYPTAAAWVSKTMTIGHCLVCSRSITRTAGHLLHGATDPTASGQRVDPPMRRAAQAAGSTPCSHHTEPGPGPGRSCVDRRPGPAAPASRGGPESVEAWPRPVSGRRPSLYQPNMCTGRAQDGAPRLYNHPAVASFNYTQALELRRGVSEVFASTPQKSILL